MPEKIMKCGHEVIHYELSKYDDIVYCTWICVEGCRATERIGEACQWDTTAIDEQ